MKTWKIKKEYQSGDDVVKLLLENREITSPADQDEFLNPPKISYWIDKLGDEFKQSLILARNLVNDAMRASKPIVVHGDYDADGVCATAILYQALMDDLKYTNTHYFIPSRFEHGYGLSVSSLTEIKSRLGECLVITVDSGITAVDEVAKARNMGLDIIITDHHQKPPKTPDANCIVWSDNVAGSTLAWMLARAVGSKNPYSIALAAVATVTDLQPILGFNRSIVKVGLEVLNTNPPLGLHKLIQVAGRKSSKVTTYDLGWVIGPRLNASGRLVEAEDSLKLLLENDESVATELAIKLNTVNITRQNKTEQMFELASDIDTQNLPLLIFSAKPDYHEGIIGLVASKIVQNYYRPAVVISISEGMAKGSVRSVSGVNIIELLREVGDIYENLGGHPMAAGFSIKTELLDTLKDRLETLAQKYVKEEHLTRSLNIDLAIDISLADMDLYKQISMLEPYGMGNEEPVFCTFGVSIAGVDKVGVEGRHLSMKFYKNGQTSKGIWFGAGEKFGSFKTGDVVDVAYNLNRNEFNGKVHIDLMVRDLRKV